ncbi:isoflavone reductase family protein-like protein [Leptodontidium sp. MPI-SDFR-AT-0119]|nr:isoflavone reductase family protein-like protein [Leptodontidium sp. MPI-SDFR-AT-0119]
MAPNSDNMMRIVIAGSGGLARVFAHYIHETAHQVVILSRQAHPELEALDYTVIVVNYDSQAELRHALRGVDLVISTVSGNPQINLMDAAAHSDVSRFVPAEFEGPPSRRPRNDPVDRGRAACLERLRHWSRHNRHPMPSTIFTCGVFYERFARGGLGSMNIGTSSNCYYPGSYLMNIETGTAEIVETTASGNLISVAMTSINDVAMFIVAALELGIENWPGEFRMQGDRKTITEIVQYAESVKGGTPFETDVIQARDLNTHLEHATYYQDFTKVARIHELIATEQRRYDYTQPNLNAIVNVVPTSFWTWLNNNWGV